MFLDDFDQVIFTMKASTFMWVYTLEHDPFSTIANMLTIKSIVDLIIDDTYLFT